MKLTNDNLIQRSLIIKIYLVFLSLIALSFLRPILFISLPVFVLLFFWLFHAKTTTSTIIILLSIQVAVALSTLYMGELNLSNNFLSIYFIFPLIILFFSRIKIEDHDYFQFFMQVITVILIFNNLVGLVQLIRNPGDDDAFNGFYGTHGLGLHTLSLVNYMVGIYHFIRYQNQGSRKNLMLSAFFIVSAILSFYGLGLIVFLITIFIYKFSLRRFFGSVLIFAFVLVLFGSTLFFFKKQAFYYNLGNLKRVELFFKRDAGKEELSLIPRKLLLFRNYVEGYSQDFGVFLLGSGPGTFNSRAYFLLNGDYSRSKSLEKVFGTHDPVMAKKYVHPLWNTENTGQYMDGTRNEPFSSIIAFLSEYGFIVSLLVAVTVYSRYKTLKGLLSSTLGVLSECNFLKFISIFVFVNLFTDNYLEYPEFILLYIVIFTLIQVSINNKKINSV